MALDRWIALVFIAFCCVYGYAAFFTMDQLLPPFMQRNPVWPSTFPKVLAVAGVIVGLIVLLGLEKPDPNAPDSAPEINYRRLTEYKLGQALSLLGAMVGYALLLRPAGFLLATVLFLAGGAMILGERKLHILLPVACLAAGLVWYLVQQVLGIFLTPLPAFL
jgi:putative tricarboxylic transport membrane protein